ncbi:uncharacterized protein TRIVIDRAFT_69382 [Trichoderma virens Gv29-8]|uniref:Uncharacterized protein n=1 Tax=Hypocrea virens (strain Gv29-8 / FGSC 10586) TaxID=413071 RepID=G9MXS1_HYPVG|nr:uncharacterized protein TRIVIDRAFT_69382 [Trichoderma virens Gv29-8]EHK20682.1 hypothetical protein TRIVIDRAFT_69382 [Trichoderma virens Gv29-8]
MVVQASSTGDDRLIIALDFGTTFSGITYCFTNERDSSPTSIEYWPGSDGAGVPKIPTVIRYDSPVSFTWGAQVNRQDGGIVGVKLLLDPSQPRPKYLPEINVEEELGKLPKSPVQVAADFIGAVYNHAMKEIGKKVSQDYVKLCRKVYVLSVPAVWSDAAKNSTLTAARAAGLSPVQLIKEPEAAALWTAKKLDVALHSNDAFVVCDAGGGTVDLISYQVEEIDPRLKLKELVPGTGGMVGSLGLNQRFECAVRKLVGERQWKNLQPSKAYQSAARQFDKEVKKYFQGKLEDDEDKGLESNTWTMTGEDVMAIFNPIIYDILKLIDEQVESVKLKLGGQNPKYIFLVGGFGSSQYLMSQVEAKYPGIQVLQPPDAWAAIAKGAAISGMETEATVTSSSSTRHYGVEAWGIYEEDRDKGRPSRKGIDDVTRVEVMTWYIKIGEDLARGKTIRFPFFRSFAEGYTDSDLQYNIDTFRTNCTVVADLSKVPKEKFTRKTTEGKFTTIYAMI